MSEKENLVDIHLINEMLFGDQTYVKEFAGASIESFTEFSKNFKTYLLAREKDDLRRAGHKIKPVAQMLHLNPVVSIYEKSKEMLEKNASTEELANLADEMEKYCNRLLYEFKTIQQQ